MRVSARIGFAAIGAFVVLLVVAAYVVFDSERGSRWALEFGLSMSPVPMTADDIGGTLLDGLSVGRFELDTTAVSVVIERMQVIIDWGQSIQHRAIVIEDLRAAVVNVQQHASQPSAPRPIEIELPALPLTIELATVEVERLSTNVLDVSYHPSIRFGAYFGNDAWRVTNVELAAPALRAQGRVEVAPFSSMAATGAFGFRAPDLELHGDLVLSGDLEMLRVAVELKSPLAADITARISILGRDSVEVDAEIATQQTQYQGVDIDRLTGEVRSVLTAPLTFDAEFDASSIGWGERVASDVRLIASGGVDAYNVVGTATVEVPDLPTAQVRLDVDGDSAALRAIDYSIQTPSGSLRGSGSAVFDPLSLNLIAHVDRLDPGYFADFVSGHLSGDATVAISAEHLEVDVRSLSGAVNEQPITLSGRLSRHLDAWQLKKLAAVAGDNTISGDGSWSDDVLSFDGVFDLPHIEHFYPGVVGDARGHLSAGGTTDAPNVAFELDAASIAAAGVDARGLQMRAAIVGGRIQSATLTADSARVVDQTLTDVSIRGSGRVERFEVDARLRLGEDETVLRWAGFWRDAQLGLDLAQGSRVAGAGEVLTNEAVAQIRWRAGALTISAHCWSRGIGAGRLCVDDARFADTSHLSGSLVDLPVSVLTALAPQLPGTEGVISGRWNFGRTGDSDWRGEAELTTSRLALVELGSVDDDPVAVPDITARVGVTTAGLEINASMGGETDGVITAQFVMQGYEDEAPIQGHIAVSAANLGALSQFSRRVGDVSGSVRGRFEFAGTRASPRLDGKIEFDQGRFVWLDPHIEIEGLDIDITMPQPQRIEVRGSGVTARGRVDLDGVIIDPFLDARRLTLDIDAAKVDVGIPEGSVRVNADVQLTWRNAEFDLRGKVDVPRARIEVATLPESTVQRSRDVVVVDRTTEREQVTRLAVDLDLTLGDDVRFKGFGLSTRLAGRLRLRQARDGGVRLDGTVSLMDGSFGAFGQMLTLESGRLIFAGPPEDPLVTARAVRTIEEPARTVKVGVDIQGRAGAIESTLFANPSMPEADTLSYLVLGRPLSAASQQESGDLTGAAIALGLKGAAPIVDEIRGTLGLEELTATGGSSEELALIAGKRVSDRVYVRYSYQTFSRMSALLVRLVLNNRLSLEATAAQSPAMDVIYRVGRDD